MAEPAPSTKQYPLTIERVPLDFVSSDPEPPLELASKQYATGFDLRIIKIRELRQKSGLSHDLGDERGSTLEVTYDLTNSGLTYKTATNLAIFPENPQSDVELVAKLLGFYNDLEQRFMFKPNPNFASKRAAAPKHPFLGPCTVREALTKYVDLRGQLRKKLVTDLAGHCTDAETKKK
jgi:sulfite reductase alpha subunit-like flavoprotein